MTAAAAPGSAASRPTVLGLPRTALAEIVVFYAAALVFDALVLDGTRFRDLAPHPFWLFLLVVSAHYGTAAGVVASVLGTLLAFLGNLPPRDPLASQSAYLLLVLGQPLLWFASAVVLGELRTRQQRLEAALRAQVADLTARNDTLTAVQADLGATCERLQTAAAGQVQTTVALLRAAQGAQTLAASSVFASAEGLIGTLMTPSAYSIYLCRGDRLELAARCGDGQAGDVQPAYDRSAPLYRAIVEDRQLLHVAAPDGQAILGQEGVVAGPLLDGATGDVVGMLKIEGLPIAALRDEGLHAFRFLCGWIGTTWRNACRYEAAAAARLTKADSDLLTDASYAAISKFVVALAERACFPVSQLTIRVTHESLHLADERPGVAVQIEEVVASTLRATDLAFDCHESRGEYLVLLPMTPAERCQPVADRVRDRIHARLADHGYVARLHVTFETLHTPNPDDARPSRLPVIRRSAPYSV